MKKALSAVLALILLFGCFSGVILAVDTAEVATIDSPSSATTEAAVILNPTGKTPAAPTTFTKEMYHTMIQETAKAYFYHNPDMQYDGVEVDDADTIQRHMDDGRPEDAAVDSKVYSVCSNYCWKVYQEVFGHNLFRMSYGRTRTWADLDPAKTPELVYQYSGPSAKNSKGETDINKAVKEARKVLEPGDVIVRADTVGGHAMLFVGDAFGDGKEYILHCYGDSHTPATGNDPVEVKGSIGKELVDAYCFTEKKGFYLGDTAKTTIGFAILRPLWDPAIPKTPTEEGLARLQYLGLNSWRELDRLKFESALPGEEIPVYLTIANKGLATLNEVPVEEYIPEGTTLVEGSLTKGAKVEGNTIKWAVKIPAGKEITLTYKVKLNGRLGDTVDFKGGLVGGIASRSTSLVIGGQGLPEEMAAKFLAYANANATYKAVTDFKDLQFFNDVYREVVGVDLGLPQTTNELLKKLSNGSLGVLTRKTDVAMEDSALNRMVLPLHFTGRSVSTKDNWDRTRDYDEVFYQPGDLFICTTGSSTTSVKKAQELNLYIYLGDGKILQYNTQRYALTNFRSTIQKAIGNKIVIVLRPTLAYGNLMNRVPSKMSFTDVKAADWYYTFVKDLVYDGTVNGMSATSFAPNGKLTYGQALKLVTLAVGEKEQAAVAGGHWASGYEKLAKEKGWLTETVSMDKEITRLQFCQIAAKAAGLTGAPAKNPFTDCSDAGVLALNNAGVISGMTETTFAPNQPLTRAQIAKIIWCLREAA